VTDLQVYLLIAPVGLLALGLLAVWLSKYI
jgi:hypothetical protein